MFGHPVYLEKLWYLAAAILLVIAGFVMARDVRRSDPRVPAGREHPLLLALVLLAGAVIRLYGTDFGLPSPYHPDEFKKTHLLASMFSRHSLDPKFGLQPPLLLYLTGVVATWIRPFHLVEGNSIVRYLLAGRIVSALCGTFSIFLLNRLARRVSSPGVALFAATVLCIAPLHVACSRYLKEDVLFLMFALGTVLAVLKALDEDKRHFLSIAGFLAGLSFGSKYTGLLTVVAVLSAPWLRSERFTLKPDRSWVRPAILGALCMPIGILLVHGYLLESGSTVWQLIGGFRAESRHAANGHLGSVIDPWSQLWMFHLSNSLAPGLSVPICALALLGAGIAARERRTRPLFMIALTLLFYLPAEWARSKPMPQPDRYVLACVPFMAILAGNALERIVGMISQRNFAFVCAAMIVLAFPLTRTLEFSSEIRNDTRLRALTWMHRNLPAGTSVLLAGGYVYLPRVPQKLNRKFLRGYLKTHPGVPIQVIRSSNFDYLILSEFDSNRFETTSRPRKKKRLRRNIQRTFPIAASFESRYGSYGFHNPTITIYRIPKSDDVRVDGEHDETERPATTPPAP